MQFLIESEGDRAVGIDGQSASVEIEVSPTFADKDIYITLIKENLAIAFGQIWDERVTVYSQEEIDLWQEEDVPSYAY